MQCFDAHESTKVNQGIKGATWQGMIKLLVCDFSSLQVKKEKVSSLDNPWFSRSLNIKLQWFMKKHANLFNSFRVHQNSKIRLSSQNLEILAQLGHKIYY